MKKTFCDRCKKEVLGGTYKIILSFNDFNTSLDQGYDLCNECYNEIENAVKNNIKFCSCPTDKGE